MFVMYTEVRGTSIASRIDSSSWPAWPTNGRPVASSVAPGPSPTSTSLACGIALARHRVGAVGTELAAVGGADPLRHRVERRQRGEIVAEQHRRGRRDGESRVRESAARPSSTWARRRRRPRLGGGVDSARGAFGRHLLAALPSRRAEDDLGAAELDLLRKIAPPLIGQGCAPRRRESPRPPRAWTGAAGSAPSLRGRAAPRGWCRPRSRRRPRARR